LCLVTIEQKVEYN